MSAGILREFESLLRLRPARERSAWRRLFRKSPERALALLQSA